MFILQAVWLWTRWWMRTHISILRATSYGSVCADWKTDSGIKDSSVCKNQWQVERLCSWCVSVIEKPHRLGCSIVASWSSAVTEGTVQVTNTMTRLTGAEVTDLFGLLRCSCQWQNISPRDCNSPDRTAPPSQPPMFSTDQNPTRISFWQQEQDNTQCIKSGKPFMSSWGFFCCSATEPKEKTQLLFSAYFWFI